ncbi:MAG: D-alanyl-D-alanine carboxypeptidase/D-alanyl-D-alanine-endopeptidase [Candidatus Handelsmanbacteria bacterium RIFCSPLOWO2_12_FULL_64_10]|uniref:D-alanyl-D-alanine carboxypeptidase/D-alanyl-D-alanine-endopeptidase n=1 Tax=Handelsmanbacteria sp. (strain RIFCSPLOWO2_12_FULL_64_10) TaxID=1817868 RepID=A0A1F6C5A4_HANXR|nr:MAG: D-alanyl-D-alanine carboxypeptidase/D-alanyl-D-alanine-endopeptidase [Candidatus Handelsmanbacteria bacterium RIFCSPLOWO2_12_FULL_64_10]
MIFALLLLQASLAERIDALVAEKLPEGARASILVVRGDRALYARDAGAAMIPASNTKLFSTAAAWTRLGRDYRFETRLYLIDGDLHVVAGGDPNISGRFHDGDPTAVFKSWAARLKGRTIRNIVLHDPHGGAVVHPDWARYEDGPWWKAPVAWFSFNDNCVDVRVSPGAALGDPATISLSPDTAFVTIDNRTTTVNTVARGKDVVYSMRPGSIVFSRQIALKARPPTWSIPVEDPAAYFGAVLSETLSREGVRVTGEVVRGSDPIDAEPLLVHRSTLADALKVTNTRSHNLYAELLARHVAVSAGRPATFEDAARAVTAFAASIGAGNTALDDGCGLSRDNRTTARDVVTLLLRMRDDEMFVGSLAEGGDAGGTLRDRLAGTGIRAKTGTIDGVDALSGYAGDVTFSILLNGQKSHAEARALIDAIAEAVVGR